MSDREFVSAKLNKLPLDERWAYVRAMKRDFDRLHDLDQQFPQLFIISHVSFGKRELDDLVLVREVAAAERLRFPQYWFDPVVKESLYTPNLANGQSALRTGQKIGVVDRRASVALGSSGSGAW